MQEKIISLENVNKIFKNKNNHQHVLKNITFDVMQGEVISLIGPSGSGKSTCLRTINALETITSGRINVCGFDYQDPKFTAEFIRRHTGMVFQRFELFSQMTALENIMLGPVHVLKKSKDEARLIATELLKRVDLESHANKYPIQLSGGQQQRIAIARALSVSPKVLLCDEPTSALDPELVDDVTSILADIAKDGMTMIIVTHEMSFAKKVSNRTLFLEQGNLVEQGPSKELFESPKSDRLKQFLNRIHS